MPLLLAGAAWGLLKTRMGEPPRDAYVTQVNLVQAFMQGEFVRPTTRLNLGSPRGMRHTVEADPRRRSLASGFLTREGGEPPFAIGVGDTQRLTLDVIEPVDRRLVLRMASWLDGEPQDVTAVFNGHVLGTGRLRLDGERSPLAFEVPAGVQHRGTNVLELRHAATREVQLADLPVSLPLASALQSLQFLRPGESETAPPATDGGARLGVIGELGSLGETRVVRLPAGVSGRVAFALPEASRLLLRFRVEQVDTSLEVSLVTDDGVRTVLADIDRRDVVPREVREDLTRWAGRVVQLEFWCRDGQGEARFAAAAVLVPEDEFVAADEHDGGPDGEVGDDVDDQERTVAPALGVPAGTRPSFLVVVLDAMARDRTSAFGAGRPTTPVLEQLARRASVAPSARSPASYTLASVGTLLTGLEPLSHGVVHGMTPEGPERLADDVPRLAELMSGGGWRTGAWITNPNSSRRHGFDRGFSHWDELSDDPALFVPEVGVDGNLLAPRLEPFLAHAPGEPFFAWVHVFEPHAPWRGDAAGRAAFVSPYDGDASGERSWLEAYRLGALDPADVTDDDLSHLEDLYDAHLLRADAVLGQVLAAVDRAGRAEETVVIVTSDHGEALGEHGRLEHGDDVHVEQVDVPLLIAVPGQRGGLISGPATLSDLAPTVLTAAGLPVPDEMEGVDLLAGDIDPSRELLSRGYGVRPTLALTRWPWRLHVDVSTRAVALYDLSRDPGENHDLSGQREVTTAWLHAEMVRLVARQRARSRAGVGEALDDEAMQALRSLGYAELGQPTDAGPDPIMQTLRSRLVRD